jgi:hypothetical protein
MSGTTLPNGQILPPPVAMYIPPAQSVPGGALNAAADKTVTARAQQIETAQKMGVGQKGGKRRFKGGAENLNAHASLLPSAGSIPGVDATNLHVENTDRLNAIRAAATGDKLANSAPYYPAKSGGKRTKRKSNGRRHHRTHRRGNRKSTGTRRRSHRRV